MLTTSAFVLMAYSYPTSGLVHSNYTCRTVQALKLLITQLSPTVSSLFLPNILISTLFHTPSSSSLISEISFHSQTELHGKC
jgi:hypothetical protein